MTRSLKCFVIAATVCVSLGAGMLAVTPRIDVKDASANESPAPGASKTIRVPETGTTIEIERVYVPETNSCYVVRRLFAPNKRQGASVTWTPCSRSFIDRAHTGEIVR